MLLVAAAVALLDRRDFGAGLLPSRPGRATASRALGSPLGLAWRLQRGSLIGWAVGLLLLGAAYGSLGNSIEQYIADNPEVADFLPGGAADIVDSYLALTISISRPDRAAYGVTSALRARGEETSGRAEPVLATATSRWAWLASHLSVALVGSALVLLAAGFGEGLAYGLTVSDAGQIPRLMAVALVYLPAVWLIVGLAVLGFGWLPRAAAAVAWVGGRLLRGRRALRRLLRPARLAAERLPVRTHARGAVRERHGDAAARHRGDRRGAPRRRLRRLPPPRRRLLTVLRVATPTRHPAT